VLTESARPNQAGLQRWIGHVAEYGALSLALALACPTCTLASSAEEVVPDSGGGLQEITVTARHRVEDAQKVPIGITAITSAQLEANPGQLDLKEIQALIPSLQIEGYSGRNQTVTIRGLGTNAGSTNDGLEQGVGLYIDGIYYARTGTAIVDLPNIASIDVLRGPQGTLFGKNTVAGAIDIQTKPPSFTPGGEALLSTGNDGFFNGRARVTGPITDTLAAQISIDKTYRDGLVNNTTYQKRWDNRDDIEGRFDLLYQPTDSFKYRLGFDYDYQVGNVGFLSPVAVLPTTLANGSVVRGFYQKAASVGYTPIPIEPFSRQVDINSSQYDKMPSGGVTGRGDWEVGGLTLTSITGYRNYKWLPNFDADYTGANVYTEGIVITHQQQFSQELRISSPSNEVVEYTGGLYYWWQENNDESVTSYGTQASGWLLGTGANSAYLNNLRSVAKILPITSSYAGYGQATWHITPDLSLTGGVRYTYEIKNGSYSGTRDGDIAPLSSFSPAQQTLAQAYRSSFAPVSAYSASTHNGDPSGTVDIAYNVTPDVLAYGTYSRGFKSAGINLVNLTPGINVIVQPEHVDDYELGVKTTLFDRSLTLNGNLFWTNDFNFQTNIITTTALGKLVGYIGNAPEVSTRGVELDATAAPLSGLTLTLSAIYDDAKYVNYPNATCPYLQSYQSYCNLSGQPLAGTPRWSASASAEYKHAVGGGGAYVGYAGGDWHLQSSLYSAVNDDPFTRIAGYGVVNAHVGVRHEDGWDAELWVRNLFDKNYYNTLAVASASGVVVAAYGEPRLFGVTLRKSL